jgi:hypothetical protein
MMQGLLSTKNQYTEMKNIKFLILFAFLASSLFQSCEPDTTVPLGDVRDQYVGTWVVTETKLRSAKIAYEMIITKDNQNSAMVLIDNFGSTGSGVMTQAIATESTLTVQAQSPATGVTVSGSASLTSQKIMNWTYSLTIGGDKSDYSAIATKQ